MSWRTIYIGNQSHLSFKNNYLVIKSDSITQVHLSEINTIIIDSTLSTMSIYLMNKLNEYKIKVVVCDDKHNPALELMPYYGAYDTSKMIAKEVEWQKEICGELWKQIVKYKIKYQSNVLRKNQRDNFEKLDDFQNEIEYDDLTNREGHAAKVYFNSLFGKDFSRDDEDNMINAYLNYGYSIILSMFNREIVKNGYITQIGIHHRGPKNPFNLSCDLMEPFRPIVDQFAYDNRGVLFDKNQKIKLINLINKPILYDGKKQYLTNVIGIYVKRLLDNIESGVFENKWFEYDTIEE